MVLNCARHYFYQYANHPPNHLLSIELKYPDFFFTTFRFASFHFILFCASWALSWEFTLSKGRKLRGNVVFTTTAICIYFASLMLICKLLFICRISLETKISILNSQMLAFWGHPFYFGYQDFKSYTSDFSLQRFNVGKLGEMLQLIKVTQHTLRPHNLIFLLSFILLLSPKQ